MTLPMLAQLILLTTHSLANAENDYIKADPLEDEISNPCSNNYYEPDLEVALLTNDNFNENNYYATSASLVQFYSHNCTSCRCDGKKFPFSFLFKAVDELQSSISGNWKHVLTLKQINCADNRNTQLCREYGITEYPTLRFFPPLLKTFNTGKSVPKNIFDLYEYGIELVNLLQNSEAKPSSRSDFSPVNSINSRSLSRRQVEEDQNISLISFGYYALKKFIFHTLENINFPELIYIPFYLGLFILTASEIIPMLDIQKKSYRPINEEDKIFLDGSSH